MHINAIAVGTRMPAWVTAGTEEYSRRLPAELKWRWTELALGRRKGRAACGPAVVDEGQRMLASLAPGDHVVALDVAGQTWSTAELAGQLERWLGSGRSLALLIGGPDGLAPACLERAAQRWSLSPLTLPHPLVRVVLVEQLYRAWSLLNNHPYHRA